MPKRQRRKGQALMVELQNYDDQGISIWIGGDLDEADRTPDSMLVREDISYMNDGESPSSVKAM